MEKISKIKAIKLFFEADGGRKVTMEELKELNNEERREIGRMCADELGVELDNA